MKEGEQGGLFAPPLRSGLHRPRQAEISPSYRSGVRPSSSVSTYTDPLLSAARSKQALRSGLFRMAHQSLL
uniref:Uncharacterized protein n=1 Tax=Picea glauca TaxID=3330 RepID=A0A101LWG5_PICGL|nr:hypothetical protein ABT39_MTgene1707 [Picea glauca]